MSGCQFVPLDEDEILNVVLPQLTAIPRWVYDAKNPADQQMGRDLWHKVDPSLRDLVSVLDTASQIAETDYIPKVLAETIQKALPWAGLVPDIDGFCAHMPEAPPPEPGEGRGQKEKESEDRSEGRRRRHARRKTTD